jgi:hypothetical protein
MRAPTLPAQSSIPTFTLTDALAIALERGQNGWHRVLVSDSPLRAERFIRKHLANRHALIYRVCLSPWLYECGNPLDVLYPYRFVSRTSASGAVVLIDDVDVLLDPNCSAWRDDPLAARVVRRTLLSSRVPSFWCARDPHAVAPEIRAHSVPLMVPNEPDDDSIEQEKAVERELESFGFLVRARV